MSWASELPEELLFKPFGLVILSGLDLVNSSKHKKIWETFTNNRRSDRLPLNFKYCDIDYVYPKCKSKKTNYEWHTPKGILKKSWMKKHLELIPSIVVIFFDLDWDEIMWKEKQQICGVKVDTVRNSLSGRQTRLVVVLIQKNTPLPPGEDVTAADRAASICTACNLSSKSLFILPNADEQLLGFVIRLESAFYEISQSYYNSQARNVKGHRDSLNKTNHQLLFVRHQYKIAFYNEMKQDNPNALKHYKQAYTNLMDVRIYDMNILEVKTIAGFINYKICFLSFILNAPLDSIQQFRKHVDFFKSREGPKAINFEHSAWMSKQFQLFGDLFEDATRQKLTAIQTQHPGFYYQQAANHAIFRKKRAYDFSDVDDIDITNCNHLERLHNLDYFGQRPWRQGHQRIDMQDLQREREAYSCLRKLERSEEHSKIIIPLLSSAVQQFKKYRSSRMKRYLMIQIAEEHLGTKDYGKALTILSKVIWDYRSERWWKILTFVSSLALQCSYITVQVQDYISFCFEYISNASTCSFEEKMRVNTNINKLFSGFPPEPEPSSDKNESISAKNEWKNMCESASQLQDPICIQMHNLVTFLDIKTFFTKKSFNGDEEIGIGIYLRSYAPLPFIFDCLLINFNYKEYNNFCCLKEKIQIEDCKEFSKLFYFYPFIKHVNSSLYITDVQLIIGEKPNLIFQLNWMNGSSSTMLPIESSPFATILPCKWNDLPFDNIPINNKCEINLRKSNVDLNALHGDMCLVNEFYEIIISIVSCELITINDIKLSVFVKEEIEGTNFISKEIGQNILNNFTNVSIDKPEFNENNALRRTVKEFEKIEPGEEKKVKIFLKCLQKGKRTMTMKLAYSIKGNRSGIDEDQEFYTCHLESNITIDVHEPIRLKMNLCDPKMNEIEEIHVDEEFFIILTFENLVNFPLFLISAKLKLVDQLLLLDENHLENVLLPNKGTASYVFYVSSPKEAVNTMEIGDVEIFWKRQLNCKENIFSKICLPEVQSKRLPILIDIETIDLAYENQPVPITYKLTNKSANILQMNLNLKSSDAFIFSGIRQKKVRVLPDTSFKFELICIPVFAGMNAVPELIVEIGELKTNCRHSLYILPKSYNGD